MIEYMVIRQCAWRQLIAWIVWYLATARKASRVAEAAGVQEVPSPSAGHDPDVIVVKAKPVRLLFNRQESSMCSEWSSSTRSTSRPNCPEERRRHRVYPAEAGEIPFQSDGMLRGKVVVR